MARLFAIDIVDAGALGGTQCAYATCFAKLLSKPLITIVHSVHHNIDDPLQVLTGGLRMAGVTYIAGGHAQQSH
jgi:hypothetical protein